MLYLHGNEYTSQNTFYFFEEEFGLFCKLVTLNIDLPLLCHPQNWILIDRFQSNNLDHTSISSWRNVGINIMRSYNLLMEFIHRRVISMITVMRVNLITSMSCSRQWPSQMSADSITTVVDINLIPIDTNFAICINAMFERGNDKNLLSRIFIFYFTMPLRDFWLCNYYLLIWIT